MPTILDLFKKANGDKEVTTWNGGHKNKGLGGKIMDFVKAEANPNGPRVLFYKKLVTPPLIYGTETPRISLKGTVDPARSLATKSAKYNDDPNKAGAKPPLLNVGSLLGGSANRPSDTIFKNKSGAPITVGTLPTEVGDHTGLKYAVEAGEDYFISKAPMGPNALSGVLKGDMSQMGTKIVGAGISSAKKAIGKAVTKALTSNRKKGQKTKPDTTKNAKNLAGTLYTGGTKNSIKNSEYFTSYNDAKFADKVIKRDGGKGYISLDDFNYKLLSNGDFENDKALEDSVNNKKLGQSYIKIKPYGKQYSLVFPAAISGISEDIAPEWSPFKYIGSPFNVYRYQGVERSLKFEFKLYYVDNVTKHRMISNLNSLKELTFPYNEVSHIKYAKNDVALAFSPNLIELSISGLYNNMFGFIDSLSFSIDDNTSWSTTDPNMSSNYEFDTQLYPSVINVSFSMKIIENPVLDDSAVKTGTKVYRYNFDGKDYGTISARAEIERDVNALHEKISKNIMEASKKFTFDESLDIPPPESDDAIEPPNAAGGVGIGNGPATF